VDAFLNSKQKIIIWLLYASWLVLSFSNSVQAQDLTLNTPFQSSLESGMSETLSFIAREGQMLSFVVRGADSFDPILSIEDLNGNTLIRNDDYNYPTSRDALIEAFSAPYTGAYTMTVRGYGNTSGNYELLMLSGYSQIAVREPFDSVGNWSTVGLASELAPQLTIINGMANLLQEGINQESIAIGIQVESEVYYVHARISSVTGARGWQAGLVFRYQDANNYYQVLINQNGAWRMIRVSNGEVTILRNWNVHPAIAQGSDSFDLGVLVNGTGFDVFYDGQYIGTESDSELQGGQVGLAIRTADALGSRVTARYDELLISIPTEINGESVFPTQLIASNMNYTLRELERRLLVPQGGEMAFILPESFAQAINIGVSRFPIGNGTMQNFVLATNITWAASGADLNACGITVRDQGDSNQYILAYVDSMGGYGLAERDGEQFIQNIFNERIEIQQPPYQMILIVNGNRIHYYLEGEYVASLTTSASEGQIREAIVNFETANTNCQYDDLWVWQW
jgi:hypothetical protein